jgi:hypothetical protein
LAFDNGSVNVGRSGRSLNVEEVQELLASKRRLPPSQEYPVTSCPHKLSYLLFDRMVR